MFRIETSPVIAVTPERENDTNTSEPQRSDETTISRTQSTQSGVLHDGEFLLHCYEKLPEDERFEYGEIQGNRSLSGKMSKVSITTPERRNAGDFASEYVVKKQCKRRKQYVPRRVCRTVSSCSFQLNFKYKSSEGRLNRAERKLMHLTPSKLRDNIGKQCVNTQRPLSERTPVSPSGGTPVSSSGGTPEWCSRGTLVSPLVETPASYSRGSPIMGVSSTPVFSNSAVQSESSKLRGAQTSCQESAVSIGAQPGAGQALLADQNYTIPHPKESGGSMVACSTYSKASAENQFSRHPVLPSSKESEAETHTVFPTMLPQTRTTPYDCCNSLSSVGTPSSPCAANPFSVSGERISSSISNAAISRETRHKHDSNVAPHSWANGLRLTPQKVENVPAKDAPSSFFPMIVPTLSYNGYSSVTDTKDRHVALDEYQMNTLDAGLFKPVIVNSFTIGDSYRFFQVGDGYNYGAFGDSVEKEVQRIYSSGNSLASSVSRGDQAFFAGHTNLVQSLNCGLVDLNSTLPPQPISLETFYSFSTQSSQESPLHEKPRMRYYKPTRTIFSRWSLEPVSSVISPP